MSKDPFGTTAEYFAAFQVLASEGISEKHIALLKEHVKAPEHTISWARLAKTVGYPNRNTVQLQYGKLAHRVASLLGFDEKPNGFWLNVLADWGEIEPRSGHTQFVLRRPVIAALLRLAILHPAGADRGLFPDEMELGGEYFEGARKQVWVNAYERNPQARRACITRHGTKCTACGISFAERYGKLGEGFIHVHHLKPMAMKTGRYKLDPVKDLRPVCPNCHAMLHRADRVLSIEQLRRRIRD